MENVKKKNRKKIVFFLGAGASKPLGVPLTNEILRAILERINKRKLFEHIRNGSRESLGDYSGKERRIMEQDLNRLLYRLMPGLEDLFNEFLKNKSDTVRFPLITEILSIVDHMSVNGNIPCPDFNSSENDIAKDMYYYRGLLDRAIYEILDKGPEDRELEENQLVERFASHIKEYIDNNYEVSIITTNYDTTIEVELYNKVKNVEDIDFGISWRDVDEDAVHYQPVDTKLRIYKLHGSLNWLKCDICDYLYINPYGNIINHSFRSEIDELNQCDCGNNARLKSIIVAPSFEREIKEPNLLHIWKSSVEALRNADKWVIIGYSLPPEDLAIKSLLIRGRSLRSIKKPLNSKALTIVQKGDHSLSTYSLFFRNSAFKFIEGGLEKYLDQSSFS